MPTAHLLDRHHRYLILWRGVLSVLIALALYNGAGLVIGGPASISTATYEVIRAWPGGARVLGALLLLLAATTCWAWGRGPTALVRVLPLGVVYHAGWALCIAAAYLTAGVVAWPALGSWAALSALWALVALTIPPAPPPPYRRATDLPGGDHEGA